MTRLSILYVAVVTLALAFSSIQNSQAAELRGGGVGGRALPEDKVGELTFQTYTNPRFDGRRVDWCYSYDQALKGKTILTQCCRDRSLVYSPAVI